MTKPELLRSMHERIGKGQSSLEDLQTLNKTFGMETTANFDSNDYDLATDFIPYIGKESISELSKTEKKSVNDRSG